MFTQEVMEPAVPPHCYRLGGEQQVRKPGMHACSLNSLEPGDARTGKLSVFTMVIALKHHQR